MTSPMSPARFAALLDAEGGDLARWPAAEREAAEARLAADPAAREALRACAPLDAAFAALRAAPPAKLPPALAARLAQDAARAAALAVRPVGASRPGRRRAASAGRSTRRPMAAAVASMAASVALGLWLGGGGIVDPFGSGFGGFGGVGAVGDLAELDLFAGADDLAGLFGDAL